MPVKVARYVEIVGDAGWSVGRAVASMVSFVGELSIALAYAVLHPRKIRWRETLYYMDMCGSGALPICALICFLMGLILGFQGALQLHKYGGDIFLADFVAVLIVKEMGPLMIAVISTGRAGSAFAAEIGTMKVSEEIDAMLTMGFVPSRFLVIPKIIALVTVLPLLTIFGDLVGIVGGFIVGYTRLELPLSAYYNRTLISITPMYFAEGLIKSVVYAFIIAAVGCMRGFESDKDAQGVGRAATSAVVTSVFFLAVADAIFAVIFGVIIGR
ncbi:MAG: hypothetical protein A2X49_13800 [Lentisphaerae bacterium GWF2_52_8]|nr:MAG: hypothetical protein A2X49_13800 [Lentisphaerae bacterium GWF2_52_8]